MLATTIAALGRELGFVRIAVVPIEPPRRHAIYERWLGAGHAGEMAYLAAPAHVAQRGRGGSAGAVGASSTSTSSSPSTT